MLNKRGQELSLTTIILIVLGIAVLVFLIWGFSAGWSNLWAKIIGLTGGADNTNEISQACSLACTSQNKNGFCTMVREVKFGKEIELGFGEGLEDKFGKVSANCNDLSNGNAVVEYEGEEYSTTGLKSHITVEPCPGLCS